MNEIQKLVDDVRGRLGGLGYDLLFVTFECASWQGQESGWVFTVQAIGPGRLAKLYSQDPDELITHAYAWLELMEEKRAA